MSSLAAVEITGIVVISVVIVVCSIIALAFCLLPTIEELRKVKAMEKRRAHDDTNISFANVNHGYA